MLIRLRRGFFGFGGLLLRQLRVFRDRWRVGGRAGPTVVISSIPLTCPSNSLRHRIPMNRKLAVQRLEIDLDNFVHQPLRAANFVENGLE